MSTKTAVADEELQSQLAELRTQRAEVERKQREEWQQALNSQLADLRHNRFDAPNLHALAQVCLGITEVADEDGSARQRVSDFVGGDEMLVEAVMAAIREAVFRDDVPSVDETISLHSKSQPSLLAYPVLASLQMLYADDPNRLGTLSDQRKREALAILFCVSPHRGADWLEQWFLEDPELVLDVLGQCAILEVRSGKEFVPCIDLLNGLATTHSTNPSFDSHEDLTHTARLRLLEAVPVRGPNKQLRLIDSLLAETMGHSDPKALREIARKKLSRASMNIGQRIRWIAVDALTSPEPDLGGLKQQICEKDNETRVRHLAEFLQRNAWQDDMRHSVLANMRCPNALRDAIEILGTWFPPVRWGESGIITIGMDMSDLMVSIIEQLGTVAGDETDRAFKDLTDDSRLERWHDYIRLAHERQRVISRDASYSHPSIDEAQHTLSHSTPANAADLAALLQVRLADISDNLRGGNENSWRVYWNEDEHRSPSEPKHEESCRDALLADLKARLPDEVDASPEGRYAADSRADIRVSCHGFNVPIEIKKNSNPDLWTALRKQLISKYTTDPATSGYGIYLVLWFGPEATKTPTNGTRPDTPEALQQSLQQELTADESRKISVIVLDATKPNQPF